MSRESSHSWSARTKAQSHAREAIEAVNGSDTNTEFWSHTSAV